MDECMDARCIVARSARRGRFSPPRFALPFVALLLALGSCTAPGKPGEPDGPPPGGKVAAPIHNAPDWAGEPPGWNKLTHVERWLATDAWRYEPFWQVQGELTLAEGRMSLAQRDFAAGEIDAQVLAQRVATARLGFVRVVEASGANSSQRARAQKGLAALDSMRGSTTTAKAAPGGLMPRSAWGARAERADNLTPVGGPWRRITIHHSAEVPGTRMDGSLADSNEALLKMQRAHMDQRGYGDIGYHYLVDPMGHVFEGRSLRWQGAHAGGANNRYNLGVCLIGDFEHSQPSPAAMRSLETLLEQLRGTWSISRSDVVCHRDLKSTVCPGDSVAHWVDGYRRGRTQALAQSAPPPAPTSRKKPAPVREASFRGGSGVVR